jgi:hypothetical protein
MTRYLRRGAKWLAVGCGVAVAAYAAYVGVAWFRYGDAAGPSASEQDPLLDRFMPAYDVSPPLIGVTRPPWWPPQRQRGNGFASANLEVQT